MYTKRRNKQSEHYSDGKEKWMTQIVSQIQSIHACTEYEKQRFYSLLCQSFLGVSWHDFLRDFNEKESIIILRKEHSEGEIVGFSTLVVLTLPLPSEEVKGVFSGDTVVLPEYRSSTGLGVQLGTYFLRTYEAYPQHKVYYILMSKGWRTYKILPFFFQEFSPSYTHSTPECEKGIMHAFGRAKYSRYYQPEHNIIHFDGEAARLKPESIDALPNKLDAHTRFYLQANPGYLCGDELVCVARITPANFAPPLRRLLGGCLV
jgi:hypothetical protein